MDCFQVDKSRKSKNQVRAVACTLVYIQFHIYGSCLSDCDCEVGSNMSTKVGNSLSSLVDKQDIRCPSAEPSRTMSHQFHLLPLCSKSGLREKLPPGGSVNVSLTRWVWSQTSRCSVSGLWRSGGSRRFRSSGAFVPSAPCCCCKLTAAG